MLFPILSGFLMGVFILVTLSTHDLRGAINWWRA